VERGSIKLDLHRRDFTINTLALRLDGHHYGELHDYWGGFSDLRARLVRVLHSLSFVDDPTRMLRAVRFEQRFGFRIEARTLELIQEARPLLAKVSGDRIRHELEHILEEPQAVDMLSRLHDLQLLAAIHPDLAWDGWLEERIQTLRNRQQEIGWDIPQEAKGMQRTTRLAYALWLIRLSGAQARRVINRLKIPRTLADEILTARRLWHELAQLQVGSPSQIVSRLSGLPLLALYSVYMASEEQGIRDLLSTFVTHWRHVEPTINGHDLQARGLAPGPIYREILDALRAAWLDGRINSPVEEAELLEELLEKQGIWDTG
jgi:tRNA nucleotidyltransferase (CCA-adding enzyme)